MECDGVTLLIYIVKTTNFDKFKCSLVLLMMILWFTNYIYILLASNYIQNCTKSNKKLKSCFEFSEGVPATVQWTTMCNASDILAMKNRFYTIIIEKKVGGQVGN